ncbi:hypothetical protein, partial [Nostoc sp.]|uniref:hypothetical protein n=1 Tax=Nostoc sp. TaxID=1180 RepID=UPI002FFB97DF
FILCTIFIYDRFQRAVTPSQLLGGHLLPNVSGFVILHPLPYLPSRVFSFDSFIQNTRKVTEEG